MAGYCYAEDDMIPLVENPATNNVGWLKGTWQEQCHPACLGALGLGRAGIACCPPPEDDVAGVGGGFAADVRTGCTFPCSLTIAEGNRLSFYGADTSVVFGPGSVVKVDFLDGHVILNDSLANVKPKPPQSRRYKHPPSGPYRELPFLATRMAWSDDPDALDAATDSFFVALDAFLDTAWSAYYDLRMVGPEDEAEPPGANEGRPEMSEGVMPPDWPPESAGFGAAPQDTAGEDWIVHRGSTALKFSSIRYGGCGWLRRLRSLERHIPGWSAEWVMRDGGITGGRHKREPSPARDRPSCSLPVGSSAIQPGSPSHSPARNAKLKPQIPHVAAAAQTPNHQRRGRRGT
jgi:hypothetical protein